MPLDLLKLSSLKSETIYFKLLIYSIVQTNPSCLLSNIAYIERYCRATELNSEPGFWFMQFCSAVNFTKQINLFSGNNSDSNNKIRTRQVRSAHDTTYYTSDNNQKKNTPNSPSEAGDEQRGNRARLIRTPSMIYPKNLKELSAPSVTIKTAT